MVAVPSVRVGDPITHDRLTVFPLFLEAPLPVSYRLADEALADGTAVVEELSDSGSVPQLSVRNLSDTYVLFLEGQELRGAKQNRVLNTSVLVAAKTQTVLPVSCVEQGRWRHVSKTFSSTDTHCSPNSVPFSRGLSLVPVVPVVVTVPIGAVWAEVSRQMSSLKSTSPTMAMADTMAANKPHMDRAVAEVKYAEGAAGLAVSVGGKIVAVDLFDAPATCRKLWTQLVSGVALDALEEKEATAPRPADVNAALDALRAGPWLAVPPAGAGEEHRAETAGQWHGSVLTLGGHLVHGSLVTAV